MRRLFLTTASIIALTLGGGGLALAAGTTSGSMGTHNGTSTSMENGSSASHTSDTQGMGMESHGAKSAATSQSEVKQAQEQLKSEGLYHGKVDGIMGPETKQAVSQYQKKNGLHETATLDQQTLSHLLGQTSGSGSSTSPSSHKTPSSGESGSSMQSTPQHSGSSSGHSTQSGSSGQSKQ